jgi:hypothetical protein
MAKPELTLREMELRLHAANADWWEKQKAKQRSEWNQFPSTERAGDRGFCSPLGGQAVITSNKGKRTR